MNLFAKFIFIPAFFTFTSGLSAQNRQISFEHGKWADVLEKAKKENKLVYLDCYTTWCGPCKWMAKNVFTNDSVADFYNANFVNVEIDMEKGEGKDLAKQYGIKAYPTMLFVNSGGELIHRVCGSEPVHQFISDGKDALDPTKQLAGYTKKFGNGNVDGAFAFSYFGLLRSGCQSYEKELSAYFANQKESNLASRSNWNIIHEYVDDYSSKEFMFLEKNKEVYSKLATADSVNKKINRVYTAGLSLAIRKKDDKAYEALKAKVNSSGNPDAERLTMDSDLKLYQRDGNWKKFAATAVPFADKYAKDNAGVLNNLAWAFYESITDKVLLEHAAEWAKHSSELENSYANNDTYASVLYKLGKKEEAKKTAEKAIELAKKNNEDYKGTEELLQKIEKLK